MAVPNGPFWLSQANTEFQANGWASNIMGKAGLGTTGLLGRLAGMSAFVRCFFASYYRVCHLGLFLCEF